MSIFGTDGIRGTFGRTITPATAFLLGKALTLENPEPIVVVARDTRPSGDALFNALLQGIYGGGGNAINLGILPTNAVAHFVRKLGGDFGVMISASHNPPQDNGLKVFDKYGLKLCVSKQKKIEKLMTGFAKVSTTQVFEPIFYDIENIYCDDIIEMLPTNLFGLNIALDCCFGACFRVAKMLFKKCNANVTSFCDTPNGEKINVSCGATNTEFLRQKMAGKGFHLGFSFDGDCDRLAVFQGEKLLDNTQILFAIAKYMQQSNKLNGNAIMGTILTNSGLEKALKTLDLQLLRSDVGDSKVMQAMCKHGLNVGGEESGHFLLSDYATSSDALITALLVCKIYLEKGDLFAYTSDYQPISFKKFDIDIASTSQNALSNQNLAAIAQRVQNLYLGSRVVLRKSGTEPKIRAYIEGENIIAAEKLVVATLLE